MSDHTPEANGVSPSNPFDFDAADAADLTPREIRGVRWQGRDYVLREASADACIKLTDARLRAGILDNNRLVGTHGGAAIPYMFVSHCLFECKPRSDGTEALRPVSEQELRTKWKHAFVLQLFDEAVRISRIEKKRDDKGKPEADDKAVADDADAEAVADPLPA